ncbi:hypothetical protein GCM10025865_09850 [Paraoerskovia sediminicola]|uniref:Acid-resistance membrane protein n=2 Tax=Paraoerskovia sediminicola TaxID=1138587 RepID=A0ABN6XDP7_9CELL|nr:hypothetical protein GCM10025865_09850 [Paraoerskovia sediminicola]
MLSPHTRRTGGVVTDRRRGATHGQQHLPRSAPAAFAELAHKIWYWPVIRGVLTAIFGIIAVVSPNATATALVQVFGIFVIVDGLVSLIDGLRRKGSAAGSFNTGLGVVAVIFGAVLLIFPKVFIGIVLILVAIWAMLLGIFQITLALGMRRGSGKSWVWSLIVGILLVALSITCFAQPEGVTNLIVLLIGIFAIVIGVTFIVLGLKLRTLGAPVEATAGPAVGGTKPGEVVEGEIVEE